MSYAMNFRSALNGFNREDVVNYISYLNSKHNSDISALNNEKKRLEDQINQDQTASGETQNQLKALQDLLTEETARNDALSKQLEALTAENERLQKQLEQKPEEKPCVDDKELALLRGRCAALQEQVNRAKAEELAALNRNAEQELEAYRRAERTERLARERAELIYRQASTAIDGAADKVDTAFTMISDLSDQVAAQLAQLHTAISGSKHALADAASTLYTIRPEDTVR